MPIRSLAHLLFALGLAAGTALTAMDVRGGATGALLVPAGDLRGLVDREPGFTFGAFAELPLGPRHVLRPRLDYVQAGSNPTVVGPLAYPGGLAEAAINANSRVSCWSMGVDYLHTFWAFRDRGPYAAVGLGVSTNKYVLGVTETLGANQTHEAFGYQSTKLYLNLGVGYQIDRRLGIEGSYRQTTLSGQNPAGVVSETYPGGGEALVANRSLDRQSLRYVGVGLTFRF